MNSLNKIPSLICLLTVLFLSLGQSALLSQTPEFIWETDPVFDTPESVCLNKEKNLLYVSNVGGKQPWTKDGHGFISKMSLDGEIIELEWVTGLNGPKGMALVGNNLYVADINELIIIDVEKGKMVARHILSSALSINDVTADNEGNVYLSDSDGVKIYRFSTDSKIDIFANGFANATRINGLLTVGDSIICATNGKLIQFNTQDASYDVLINTESLADGIGKLSDNTYIYSYWSGKVLIQDDGLEEKIVLDLAEEKKNAADFHYDSESKRLWVPTFFDNRISCYQIIGVE